AAEGQDLAGQIADAAVLHDHVVLDADAAEGRERVDQLPVDVRRGGRPQGGEQRVDEVEARLDGEDLPRRDRAGVAQERVLLARRRERAAHVVALQAKRV